jgi:hypothetical protein
MGIAPSVQAVRYNAYLSRPGRLIVVELEFDAKLKPGDEFPYESGIYLVTEVKPGFGRFDAILFADLTDASARRGSSRPQKASSFALTTSFAKPF